MRTSPSHHWPQRIVLLANEIQSSVSPDPQEDLAGELWLLVRAGLMIQLRREGPRLAERTEEVFEDLASQKALDLLRKVECHEWSLENRSPGEIVGYLRRVAKNALVDRLRKQSNKEIPMSDYEPIGAGISDLPDANTRAESRAVGRESALALRDCLEALQARARRVWFFKVFYGLTTKEIACHPDIQLKVGHVDVIFQRARTKVAECMQSKHFSASDLCVGSFSEIWLAMQEWVSEEGPALPETGLPGKTRDRPPKGEVENES